MLGHDAAHLLVRTAPFHLVRRPTLHEARIAVEGLADRAAAVAAEVLLALGPRVLPIPQAYSAIVLHRRRGRASNVLLVATPSALFRRPLAGVRGAAVAVELVTAGPELFAAEFFLAGGPAVLPIRETSVAIEHPRRGRTADLSLVATICLLGDWPHVDPARALMAIEGIARHPPGLAAISLLLVVPRGLPICEVGVAIEGHWAGCRDTTEPLLVAAVSSLLLGPAVRHTRLAVVLMAPEAMCEATVGLFLEGPSCLPIGLGRFAVECLGRTAGHEVGR
mmetsp:Transcript_62461/g.181101  ORF Transcript_62461/g.181101 Transcript_62461/m.181101 type:complete len:279 (+) Transcript_62461:1344-2180(+)